MDSKRGLAFIGSVCLISCSGPYVRAVLMSKRRIKYLAACAGLAATLVCSPIGEARNAPEPGTSTANQIPEKIPELVAQQLGSGDLDCPNSDPLGYEACLLFQGAMGSWQAVGLPDKCPNVENVSGQFTWKAAGKLSPEDALRAPGVPCFSYLYAMQVAVTVPVLISTATRAFRMLNGSFSEPGTNPRLCIEARHGLCGNQVAVAIELFERAGFRARPVEFYYESNGMRLNHIIPEVLIEGAWRPVDTTYGAYWINESLGKPLALRTLDEILNAADQNTKVVYDAALVPYALYSTISRQDRFDYLHSGGDILRGGEGQIRLSLRGDKGTESFKDIPDYVGNNVSDVASKGVSYSFSEDPGTYTLTVNVASSAAGDNQPIWLCVDGLCRELSKDVQRYEFTLVRPKTLYAKSKNHLAYVVLKSIEWKRLD